MRLTIFSHGDRVLLLGEGNFSFARNLFTHNLPIMITATTFEDKIKYNNQIENIKFLEDNNIPVFLDVDATNLQEHPRLRNQIFSKIIFNFPHVGGKMKIHLNRKLIKEVCESSSHLLDNGGILIISLCNGQGGTLADSPKRKWENSWQVAEMAAYGSFCLVSVEPFDFKNFSNYSCIGYRSQDAGFCLNGALVHIFRKKDVPPKLIDNNEAFQRLSLQPLHKNTEICVPFYCSELYLKSPLKNPKSGVSFFKQMLCDYSEKINPMKNLIVMSNEDIIPFIKTDVGVECKNSDGDNLKLCFSAFQILGQILNWYEKHCSKDDLIFFPGLFFNYDLNQDFHKRSPASFQFVLVGEAVEAYLEKFLKDIMSLFESDKEIISVPFLASSFFEEKYFKDIFKYVENSSFVTELSCASLTNDAKNILAHKLYLYKNMLKLETVIIYIDAVVEEFFQTQSWKELWSEDNFVCLGSNAVPVLHHGVLYPLSYRFDITLKYSSSQELLENDVYNVLRLCAIDIIKEVELINEYISDEGWSSKCFRITYQSLNEPFNRHKVLDIHTNVIAKMLNFALPVTIK